MARKRRLVLSTPLNLMLKRIPRKLSEHDPTKLDELYRVLLGYARQLGIAIERIQMPRDAIASQLICRRNRPIAHSDLIAGLETSMALSGMNRNNYRAAKCEINEMVRSGRLQRDRKGRYRLTTEAYRWFQMKMQAATLDERFQYLCEYCILLGSRIRLRLLALRDQKLTATFGKELKRFCEVLGINSERMLSVRDWVTRHLASHGNRPQSQRKLLNALMESDALGGIAGRTAKAATTEWNALVRRGILERVGNRFRLTLRRYWAYLDSGN